MEQSAARHFHISNALTYLAVLAGLAAIGAAIAIGSWPLAGALIAVSALADTFDGKFAGLFERTDSQKRLGAQLDSLADALTFGLVPVVCLAAMLSFDESAASVISWWIAALFYVLCALTRLASFNLHQHGQGVFIGIPTTVSGLIMSSIFLIRPSLNFSTAVLAACGVAMVAYIPIIRPRGLGIIAFALWPVILIILHAIGARG